MSDLNRENKNAGEEGIVSRLLTSIAEQASQFPGARFVLFERTPQGALIPIQGVVRPNGNLKRTLTSGEIGTEGEAAAKLARFLQKRIPVAWVRLTKKGANVVDWGGEIQARRFQPLDQLINKLAQCRD